MFVSITRLRLRSWRFFPAFALAAFRADRQARRSAGNVATDLLRDRYGAYWTRTLWRDEASMRAYMLAGAHRQVMPKLLDWCDEASVVHWEQEASALPDWEEAHRRLVLQGRRSKVRHPSAAHDTLDFPAPVPR